MPNEEDTFSIGLSLISDLAEVETAQKESLSPPASDVQPSEPPAVSAPPATRELPDEPGPWFHPSGMFVVVKGPVLNFKSFHSNFVFQDPMWQSMSKLPKGGWSKATPAADALRQQVATLTEELKRAREELKMWKPMTPEEAQAAIDEAESIPISDEAIERIVSKVTDPTWHPSEPEYVTMAAKIKQQQAALNEIQTSVANEDAGNIEHLIATATLGKHTTLIGRRAYELLKQQVATLTSELQQARARIESLEEAHGMAPEMSLAMIKDQKAQLATLTSECKRLERERAEAKRRLDSLLACHEQRNRHELQPNLPDCECPVCNIHRKLATAQATITELREQLERGPKVIDQGAGKFGMTPSDE